MLKRFPIFFALVLSLILVFMLSACVRPFSEDETGGTVVPEETAAYPAYPGLSEESVGEAPVVEEVQPTEEGATVEQPEGEPGVQGEAVEPTAEAAGQEAGAEVVETPEGAVEGETGAVQTPTVSETPTSGAPAEIPAEGLTETPTGEPTPGLPTSGEGGTEPSAEETGAGADTVDETLGSQDITHVVAQGENLYRIGLMYGQSWVTLAQYNNLPNADWIVVGQVLLIPQAVSEAPDETSSEEPTVVQEPADGQTADEPAEGESSDTATQTETIYVVQQGDYLKMIAEKFGVSWVDIATANGIVNPNFIYPGQELVIPGVVVEETVETEAAQLKHTVGPGETLYVIAAKYGVTIEALAEANNLSVPYILYTGQTLIIPGS